MLFPGFSSFSPFVFPLFCFIFVFRRSSNVAAHLAASHVHYQGPRVVDEGQNFTIQCTTSIFDVPQWSLNGEPIEESSSVFVSQSVNREKMQRDSWLTVYNAQDKYSGIYRCNDFHKLHHKLEVIGAVNPSHVKRSSNTQEYFLQEGQDMTLTCTGSEDEISMLPAQWYKDNVLITAETNARYKIDIAKLIIMNAGYEDIGHYRCEYVMDPSRIVPGREMYVRARLLIEPLKKKVFARIYEPFNVSCKVKGNPKEISWFQESFEGTRKIVQEIPGFTATTTEEDNVKVHTLKINNVTSLHNRTYICVARRDADVVDDQTELVLRERGAAQLEPDVITSANSNGIQELNVGSETILWCNRTQGPNEKPKIITSWSLNGTAVREDKHHTASNNHLKISHSMRTRDEGPFTCTFEDGVNKTIIVAAKVWIDRFQPLNKIKDVKSVNIVEDEDLVLHCHANSTLQVNFAWFMIQNSTSNPRKQEETIKQLFNHTVVGVDNLTSELKLIGLRSEDRAYYSCVASNEFGNDTVKMLVRVKDKYAALWPFVGIVGEVIILCTIIFIYEKRRQKPDFDDSADNPDESKSSVAQGTSKGQDIRQRK